MRAADASLNATDESPPHLFDSNPHHAVSTATSERRMTAISSCVWLWRGGRGSSRFLQVRKNVLPLGRRPGTAVIRSA